MWGRAWTLHLLVTAATIQLWEQLDLKVSTKIRDNFPPNGKNKMLDNEDFSFSWPTKPLVGEDLQTSIPILGGEF